MALYERLRQRESQTASAFASGDERIEDAVTNVGRNAWPVVDHMQFQCQLVQSLGNRDLSRHPCTQNDAGVAARDLLAQRLGTVAHDVQ